MSLRSSIQFKMEEPDIELQEHTVQVDLFYTRKTKKAGGSIKFSIPITVAQQLGLTKEDIVYFTIEPTGTYIYFKTRPDEIPARYLKSRKISIEGQSGTHYTIIPPMLKSLSSKEIAAVALIHNEGDPSYKWQIQMLPIDSISLNS